MSQNLEALIEDHADVMAEQMVKAVEWAGSEEDIRHEVNKLIDEFIEKAGVSVKGRHEYGLAGGRIDSKYGGVVIEYKDPKGSGKIIEDKNAAGVKAVVKQIKKRFHDLQAEEHVGMERIFGVGCDGDTFVFVRMRGTKIDVEDPQPVTPHTVQRLLRAVISLGARGLSFTPENLAAYFGSESKSARKGVRLFHDLIHRTDNPKAQMFFRQWQILFGEVCGYDIHGRSAKVRKLADHYHVPDRNPAELLFAVHTYYAIFMKMLAAEIVSSFSPLGISTLKKLISAPTSAKLRDELRNLEHGGIWSQLGIRNFLEGDLFSWYLNAWNDDCADVVRAMTQSFDEFDPTTLSVDPADSRDLLKHLYQQLFPRSVRHDLGEYYTPDWLAELVLDELGYDGNPDKRLLDPACGSGTFLVMAINRVKTWYDQQRHECGFGEDELLRKVLRNIIGFDLNPLAVMAARTNYLMAIRELLRHADNVELPVYLCDSIMTPSEYGDLFTGHLGNARQLKTSAGDFNIPTEITGNRDHIGRYADTLEFCIRDRYSPEQFLERCVTQDIPVTDAELHKELYRHLQKLDAENQNGVWARIIKNAFAPLFLGKVDYVAGNPPWVTFENLPPSYRQEMVKLFDGHYGLFSAKGLAARHGASSVDISALFPYVCAENYLTKRGKLSFLITQTLFQSIASSGFRKFRLGENQFLGVKRVHDMTKLQPFEDATNKTALFTIHMGQKITYPLSYYRWKWVGRKPKDSLGGDLSDVIPKTQKVRMYASPVDPNDDTSPWLIKETSSPPSFLNIQGSFSYHPHKGCDTSGANAIYWVQVLKDLGKSHFLVRNLGNAGRTYKFESVERKVESKYVYPLLRGRDVRKWVAQPSCSIICAQTPGDFGHAIPEAELKRNAPEIYSYFCIPAFKARLKERAGYVKYLKPHGEPFYALYDIKNYTSSQWKVVVREQSSDLLAAVVGPHQGCIVIPDHKLSLIEVKNEDEAHYVCGLLNSVYARDFVKGFGINTQISVSTLKRISLRPYTHKGLHRSISRAAQKCYESACKKDSTSSEEEALLDSLAAEYWGIDHG